jgi:hypothetical protein
MLSMVFDFEICFLSALLLLGASEEQDGDKEGLNESDLVDLLVTLLGEMVLRSSCLVGSSLHRIMKFLSSSCDTTMEGSSCSVGSSVHRIMKFLSSSCDTTMEGTIINTINNRVERFC